LFIDALLLQLQSIKSEMDLVIREQTSLSPQICPEWTRCLVLNAQVSNNSGGHDRLFVGGGCGAWPNERS
jgi:hypothetical protein